MKLEYVPLLQIQRDLHEIPRGRARFQQYLRTISNQDGTDINLIPLLIANPMARNHVTARLDDLLALDADKVGAVAAAEAAAALANTPGEFRVGLAVADDLMGGWTNRYACEYDLRFMPAVIRPQKKQRYWVNAVLWSSEPPTALAAREAVLTAVYRRAYVQRHGPARTLREIMAQEGAVMARAGCTSPALDEDEVDYTRAVLLPELDSGDKRTVIECLFGDAASRTLGFTPRGLSPWAGMALALHDASANPALQPNAV